MFNITGSITELLVGVIWLVLGIICLVLVCIWIPRNKGTDFPPIRVLQFFMAFFIFGLLSVLLYVVFSWTWFSIY